MTDRFLRHIFVIPLIVVLLVTTAGGAVVTRRLGTGLTAAGSGGPLPEAWVAPAGSPPKIDGRLDENVWSTTQPIVLGKLESHGPTSPRSEARLLRKDGVLYVGFQLQEPNVAAVRRAVTEPDGPAYQDDSVELFLSPYPSQGYFQLIVSSTGAIYDRRNRGDPAGFDSGAKAAVAIGTDGWSLEVAIPMASLGVGEEIPARWRANLYRNRYAGPEGRNQAFSPTLCGDYDVPERFGYLLLTPTSPWNQQQQTAKRQRGISVERLDDGRAVLLFDLAAIPKDARIHRARLLCDRHPFDVGDPRALERIEIYPLDGSYRKESPPKAGAKPLELVGPWYRAFEVTEVVRAWLAAGTPAPGLYVKKFPGWRVETTYLDLMYEGRAEEVPPAVTGLRVFDRSGQTFITWKEIEDPIGRDRITWGDMRAVLDGLDGQREVRYCVYRSDKPITADSLPNAEQIAVVNPLSCWNASGRNIARPIDRFIATADVLNWHQWNPFRVAKIDGDYGRDCPIDRFVIAEGRPPLARGTGLYVHTATRNQRAYYAVLTRVDGVENTVELSAGNSLAEPVDEKVADPEPVLQGELPKMPLFNYRQRRLNYVRWVAPPHANRPYDYYNWSVGVPEPLGRDVPLELNLHRDGYAYWRTHYRIEPGSIVLCPHDFPLKTWWYGYPDNYQTLRPLGDAVIGGYTERRLLWFVDWAARTWPVDRNRILVTGCQGGASGSGALHLGLRHPQVFNMIIAGHGEPDYAKLGSELEALWGKVAWHLKTDTGRSVWEELDLVRAVKALPPKTDLPFVSMTYSNRQEATHALAEALVAARQAVVTHTAWGGGRMIPVSAAATFPKCLRLDIRKNCPLLAVDASGKVGDAVRNGLLLWHTEGMVDQPDEFAVTIDQRYGTFDGSITLRRLQRFQVRHGKRCAWTLEPTEAAATGRAPPQPQQGHVTVGDDGLLTIRLAGLPAGTYRLTVTPEK